MFIVVTEPLVTRVDVPWVASASIAALTETSPPIIFIDKEEGVVSVPVRPVGVCIESKEIFPPFLVLSLNTASKSKPNPLFSERTTSKTLTTSTTPSPPSENLDEHTFAVKIFKRIPIERINREIKMLLLVKDCPYCIQLIDVIKSPQTCNVSLVFDC